MIDHTNLEEYADALSYDVENTLDEEGEFFLAAADRHAALRRARPPRPPIGWRHPCAYGCGRAP